MLVVKEKVNKTDQTQTQTLYVEQTQTNAKRGAGCYGESGGRRQTPPQASARPQAQIVRRGKKSDMGKKRS